MLPSLAFSVVLAFVIITTGGVIGAGIGLGLAGRERKLIILAIAFTLGFFPLITFLVVPAMNNIVPTWFGGVGWTIVYFLSAIAGGRLGWLWEIQYLSKNPEPKEV